MGSWKSFRMTRRVLLYLCSEFEVSRAPVDDFSLQGMRLTLSSTRGCSCSDVDVRGRVDNVADVTRSVPSNFKLSPWRLAATAARRCSGCVAGVDEALEA